LDRGLRAVEIIEMLWEHYLGIIQEQHLDGADEHQYQPLGNTWSGAI